MDTAVLVKEARDMGWKLLESLNTDVFPLQGAFWLYLPEAEDWRLFLVTPLVGSEGTREAYRLLREQMNRMSQDIQETLSPASNITVIRPNDERVKQLQKKYGKVEKDRQSFLPTFLGVTNDYVYFLDDVRPKRQSVDDSRRSVLR